MFRLKIEKSSVKTVENLIYGSLKIKYDSYLSSSFKAFCLHKKELIFDLDKLYDADKKMRELMMNPLKRIKLEGGGNSIFSVCDESDDSNLLYFDKIKQIFKNIKKIIIISTSPTGIYYYPFNLE